ncbi:hypothetical protein AAFC00_005127 [Neodothiora populina]|uniref:Peroxidase n=1 Tax=Neodothiora populina TaxID=2781224 RepID=A0ABR3PK55_9PEZI
MVKVSTLFVLGGLAAVDAYSFPSSVSEISASLKSALDAVPNALVRRSGGNSCPAVWTTISSQLAPLFLGSDGQCTDLARAAIRFAFHDAGTYSINLPAYGPASGGADASLLLSADEIDRPENGGLGPYYSWLQGFYSSYSSQISAADLIQFAASHAIITCPGGPKVKTVVGRTDTTTASPDGLLPAGFGPNSSHDVLHALFQSKGFSAKDLAAFLGAHSTSKAFAQQANGIPSGAAQDSTPGKWDINYYAETITPPTRSTIYRFPSDVNLSNASTTVGKEFRGFVGNQGKWTSAFADAMYRMSVLGIPAATSKNFIDCTNVLPKGTSSKRDIRAAPINDRAR